MFGASEWESIILYQIRVSWSHVGCLVLTHERCLAVRMRSIRLLDGPHRGLNFVKLKRKYATMYRKVFLLFHFWSRVWWRYFQNEFLKDGVLSNVTPRYLRRWKWFRVFPLIAMLSWESVSSLGEIALVLLVFGFNLESRKKWPTVLKSSVSIHPVSMYAGLQWRDHRHKNIKMRRKMMNTSYSGKRYFLLRGRIFG